MSIPHTKTSRRARIERLVITGEVHSQSALVEQLNTEGFDVTQATVSRDLDEIGAVKMRSADGRLTYAIGLPSVDVSRYEDPVTRLSRIANELLISAEVSANLIVLRTPPGGAHLLAGALDRVEVPPGHQLTEILGTVAGDDTVLVISKRADATPLKDALLRLAEGVFVSERNAV